MLYFITLTLITLIGLFLAIVWYFISDTHRWISTVTIIILPIITTTLIVLDVQEMNAIETDMSVVEYVERDVKDSYTQYAIGLNNGDRAIFKITPEQIKEERILRGLNPSHGDMLEYRTTYDDNGEIQYIIEGYRQGVTEPSEEN